MQLLAIPEASTLWVDPSNSILVVLNTVALRLIEFIAHAIILRTRP